MYGGKLKFNFGELAKQDVFCLPKNSKFYKYLWSFGAAVSSTRQGKKNYFRHYLAVKFCVTLIGRLQNQLVVDIADSDNSSVEEFEDASESFNGEDEIFDVDVQTKKIHRLSKFVYLYLLIVSYTVACSNLLRNLMKNP